MYDKMYGEAQRVDIDGKFYALSNEEWKPESNGMGDKGFQRRIVTCELDSIFEVRPDDDFTHKKFQRNPDFRRLLATEWKFAFLYEIFKASQTFYQGGCIGLPVVPVEWAARNRELLETSDPFPEWFRSTFRFREGSTCSRF
jgi:hypothetical protein